MTRTEDSPSWSTPGTTKIAASGLAVAVLYLALLPTVPLMEPDEGRYAEIPREMLASGDLVTPRLNGLLYFEKPPLHYWLTAASIALFGLNEVACRLPSALAGLGTIALVYLLGARLGGRGAGAWAAAVLASSPLFMLLAHFNSIDMTLTFFMTATLACFAIAWDAPVNSRARLWWYGVFAAAALAVMTKGLIGVVIPGGVIAVAIAVTGRWRVLRDVPWVSGTALFLLLAAPWHVLVARRNPSFLYFYFIHEHFLRYATSVAEREEPWWFFPAVLTGGFLPWTGVALAAALGRGARSLRDTSRRRPELILLAGWFLIVPAFFSASHSKLAPYVLPAMPPLAVLLGLYLDRLSDRRSELARPGRAAVAAAAVFTFVLACGLAVAASGRVGWLGEQKRLDPILLVLAAAAAALSLVLAARDWSAAPAGLAGAAFLTAMCLSSGFWAAVVIDGPTRSSKAVAEVLQERLKDDDLVYCFANYRQTLPVYLRRTVGVFDYGSDLAFGLSHAAPADRAEQFPSVERLRELWSSDRGVYLVVDQRNVAAVETAGLHDATEVLAGRRIVLLANRQAALR